MQFITCFSLFATAILAAPAVIFDRATQFMDPKALAALKTCGSGTGYCSSGQCYRSNYCEVGYCLWSPYGKLVDTNTGKKYLLGSIDAGISRRMIPRPKEQKGVGEGVARSRGTHDMRGWKEGVNRGGDL
ncbi:hypothetical protein GE21DRAFT_1205697 [Neurospora crassa]|nr:hypothetical protein GE21DRAFT_1205697 [Neurospora crassa]